MSIKKNTQYGVQLPYLIKQSCIKQSYLCRSGTGKEKSLFEIRKIEFQAGGALNWDYMDFNHYFIHSNHKHKLGKTLEIMLFLLDSFACSRTSSLERKTRDHCGLTLAPNGLGHTITHWEQRCS